MLAGGVWIVKAVASMIILASGSPRRRELLQQVGLDFEVRLFEIDESNLEDENPADYVLRLAESKAAAAQAHLPDDCVVIAADTTVTIAGQILGKPASQAEAFAMWRLLSGQTHQVLTGVAVVRGRTRLSRVVTTNVEMLALSEQQMQAYWATGEPIGKAGGYAIQGRAAAFIPKIEGSYSNVVGLPLVETLQLLQHVLDSTN